MDAERRQTDDEGVRAAAVLEGSGEVCGDVHRGLANTRRGFWQKQTAVLHIHLGKGEVLFNDTLGTFYLWLPAETGSSSSHSPGKRIGFI